MNKKSLFGVIGIVLFLLVVFILFGLSIYAFLTLGATGQTPKMHISAFVRSSDYSNDCDIFLMNLLRFKDSNTGLTYGELIGLSKHTGQGDEIAKRMRNALNKVIQESAVGYEVLCFQLKAQSEYAKEPFLFYPTDTDCEKEMDSHLCEAYVPDISPDKGWIKVQMAVEFG